MIKKITKIIGRIQHYIEKRECPWVLRWVKYFIVGLFHNPSRAIQFRKELASGKISIVSFNLKILGPRILKETFSVCEKVGVNAFLNYGTLLGYYREGSFIKTDFDIDLGILEEELPKMAAVKKEMKKRGYVVRMDTISEMSFQKRKYCDLYIDFWPHHRYKDSDITYATCVCKLTPDEISIYPFRSNVFQKFVKAEFEGVMVNVLEKTEEYLVQTYGEGWNVPMSKEDAEKPHLQRQDIMHPNMIKVCREIFNSGDFLDDFKAPSCAMAGNGSC